jgi:hypothetical protein
MQCGSPEGAPTYPVAIGRPSLAMTHPTLARSQVPRLEMTSAISMSVSWRSGLEDIRYIFLINVETTNPVSIMAYLTSRFISNFLLKLVSQPHIIR